MNYALLSLIQLIFGANFVTSKIVLNSISASTFASLRFTISGLILLLFCLVANKKEKIDGKFLLHSFVLGSVGFGASQALFLYGLQLTSSINTSILSTTIPLFVFLVSALRRIGNLNRYTVLGLFLSLIGVLALKDISKMNFSNKTFIGDLFVLGACFTTALFISYSKDYFAKYSALWGSTWLFLLGGISLFPLLIFGPDLNITHVWSKKEFLFCFIYSVIFATLLTYFLNNVVIRKVASNTVALFIFAQPAFAAFFAWYFLHEVITLQMIVSTCLIFAGITIVVRKT